MEVERIKEEEGGVGGSRDGVVDRSKLDTQKTYYKETFRFIDEALRLEDRGKRSEAVLCYRRSLRSITNARSVPIERSGVSVEEYKQYVNINEKLAKAQDEVLQRLQKIEELKNADSTSPSSVASTLTPSESGGTPKETPVAVHNGGAIPKMSRQPSAPPSLESEQGVIPDQGMDAWHDTKELISVQEGVRLFHVMGQDVSTWTSECSLHVYQILKDKIGEVSPPPAFLKCGEWFFPMEPGQSPVLKSGPRTYMFPDITNQQQQISDASSLPCVGIVLADTVAEAIVTRFERVLSLYTDFRKEHHAAKTKPQRPAPPKFKGKERESGAKPSTSTAVSRPEMETITAVEGVVDPEPEQAGDILADYDSKWSQAITKGIDTGSQWISWGFVKGSEYASALVEKGSANLQKRIRPNQEQSSVSPEVSRNLRQLHQTTGTVVQISAFLATTLGALVTNLGKNLAPLVVHQGHKLLPAKYKVENNEKTQQVIDDAKKVAVAGLQGFSLVFLALEQSGKNLYQSVSKAAVETVHHKYGGEAADVTGEAMGAAGNTAQAIWNVRKLGPKAIVKSTAKETGKAMLEYEPPENNPRDTRMDGVG